MFVCLCKSVREVFSSFIYISGHQFDFGVISLVDEDRMVHRGEGYNRGMTSEIDRSGSLIELVKETLFDVTPLAAYHPLGVWHTNPVVWVA